MNEDKTTFTIFTSRRNVPSSLSLNYGGTPICQTPSMKLLGLHLDKRLRFGEHIGEVLRKANAALLSLRPMLKPRSGLSVQNKVALYRIFVRSVMTYGIVVWNSASSTSMNRIQVMQNKALRYVLNVFPDPFSFRQLTNVRVHEICEIESVSDFMRRLTHNCFVKMLSHTNALIRGLTTVRRHSSSVRGFLYAIRDLI